MKIEDTPMGKKYTLDKRWHVWWFVACCFWYGTSFTLTWEPKRKAPAATQPAIPRSEWLCEYHPTEICGQCGNGCGPGSRK